MRSTLLSLCLTFTLPALAQTPAPETAPEAGASAAAASALSEQVTTLQGRLEALDEQYAETKTSVVSMQKLKFSGYLQGRYRNAENSFSGFDAKGGPLVKDGFSVRRARLKAVYTAALSSYLLQIDATPAGVVVKDAEVHLYEPWTGWKLELVLGLTKWPFGYEVVQSSGEREFPERTRVIQAFFPGERDRGAKLLVNKGIFRATIGLFDGNGTSMKSPVGTLIALDNDTEKDLVGRVGVDLKWLAAGVSGWAGKTFQPGDYTGDNDIAGHFVTRNRIGADAQLYLDLLPIGATAIKGEFVAGNTYQVAGTELYGQSALGWYAQVIQNLGLNDQIGARYDFFDGFTGTPDAVSSADPTRPAATNSVSTLGFLVTHYFDEALKVSAIYEMPTVTPGGTGAQAPGANVLTLQMQAKF